MIVGAWLSSQDKPLIKKVKMSKGNGVEKHLTSSLQNLTKIKPVRKMTFLRTGFCVAFSNDIYLFCN